MGEFQYCNWVHNWVYDNANKFLMQGYNIKDSQYSVLIDGCVVPGPLHHQLSLAGSSFRVALKADLPRQ